jgi:hypothetical protein
MAGVRSVIASWIKIMGNEKPDSFAHAKKMYRRAALRAHPDKGGKAEEFKSINSAFEAFQSWEKSGLFAVILTAWHLYEDPVAKLARQVREAEAKKKADANARKQLQKELDDINAQASAVQATAQAEAKRVLGLLFSKEERKNTFFRWRLLLNMFDFPYAKKQAFLQRMCAMYDHSMIILELLSLNAGLCGTMENYDFRVISAESMRRITACMVYVGPHIDYYCVPYDYMSAMTKKEEIFKGGLFGYIHSIGPHESQKEFKLLCDLSRIHYEPISRRIYKIPDDPQYYLAGLARAKSKVNEMTDSERAEFARERDEILKERDELKAVAANIPILQNQILSLKRTRDENETLLSSKDQRIQELESEGSTSAREIRATLSSFKKQKFQCDKEIEALRGVQLTKQSQIEELEKRLAEEKAKVAKKTDSAVFRPSTTSVSSNSRPVHRVQSLLNTISEVFVFAQAVEKSDRYFSCIDVFRQAYIMQCIQDGKEIVVEDTVTAANAMLRRVRITRTHRFPSSNKPAKACTYPEMTEMLMVEKSLSWFRLAHSSVMANVLLPTAEFHVALAAHLHRQNLYIDESLVRCILNVTPQAATVITSQIKKLHACAEKVVIDCLHLVSDTGDSKRLCKKKAKICIETGPLADRLNVCCPYHRSVIKFAAIKGSQ